MKARTVEEAAESIVLYKLFRSVSLDSWYRVVRDKKPKNDSKVLPLVSVASVESIYFCFRLASLTVDPCLTPLKLRPNNSPPRRLEPGDCSQQRRRPNNDIKSRDRGGGEGRGGGASVRRLQQRIRRNTF